MQTIKFLFAHSYASLNIVTQAPALHLLCNPTHSKFRVRLRWLPLQQCLPPRCNPLRNKCETTLLSKTT